jgi:hypothetical protein
VRNILESPPVMLRIPSLDAAVAGKASLEDVSTEESVK